MGNTLCITTSDEEKLKTSQAYLKSLCSVKHMRGGYSEVLKKVANAAAYAGKDEALKQANDKLTEAEASGNKEAVSAARAALSALQQTQPTTVGGYSSLADYGNSLFSETKEKLIRGIARDVSDVLKISSGFAESADLSNVIEAFAAVVPDQRRGRKIKAKKEMHVALCRKIGDAINKNYHMDLINLDASPEHICQAVGELLYSLFTGIHSEFITVAADVSRIMRNLTALQEYVDMINNKLVKDLASASDSSGVEASNVKEAYEAISREIRRQHAILANLSSGVIGPYGDSLVKLVEDNNEFAGLTDDLKALTGSREFADKLSHLFTGTSSVAHAAFLVDKALKKIGMSLADYKSAKDMKALRTKIYDNLVKKQPNSKEMHKMLAAADILYRHDLSHDDIAAHLSKKGGYDLEMVKGGAEGIFASMLSDGFQPPVDSVFKGRPQANKHSIGSELYKRDKYREKLFDTLEMQVRDCYNNIANELNKIGGKIGNEIKVSDELRRFVRQLGYFNGVAPERKDIHKALSGYRVDVRSEYLKHDYLKSLNAIRDSLGDLTGGGGGSYFKNVENAISKLIKVVDDFNDTFTKTLTEVHVDVQNRVGGDYDLPEHKTGGAKGHHHLPYGGKDTSHHHMPYGGAAMTYRQADNMTYMPYGGDEEGEQEDMSLDGEVKTPTEDDEEKKKKEEKKEEQSENAEEQSEDAEERSEDNQTEDSGHHTLPYGGSECGSGMAVDVPASYLNEGGLAPNYSTGGDCAIDSGSKLMPNYGADFVGGASLTDLAAAEHVRGGVLNMETTSWGAMSPHDFTTKLSGQEIAYGGDFKYVATLKKAVREIEYYFKIANIKAQLDNAASQRLDYTKNYENILGEECGHYIDQINRRYKILTCEDETLSGMGSVKATPGMGAILTLGTDPGIPCMAYRKIYSIPANAAGVTDAQKKALQARWTAYKFLLEYIRQAKIEMLEAAQALDMYLSKFTEQLQNHPDDIKDLVKMLEQIEIVAKWFTEKSGDNLCAVFESFQSSVAGATGSLAIIDPADVRGHTVGKGDHYYEQLAANNNVHPGDWQNGIQIENIDQMKEFVIRLEKSFKSMRALENVIAAFAKLSNKVSGDEIRTFMSPGLIFKAFMKYAVATSIAIDSVEANEILDPANANTAAAINAANAAPVVPGISGADNLTYEEDYVKHVAGVTATAVNPYEPRVHIRPTRPLYGRHYFDPLGLEGEYMSTDDIFEMCIKSMVAKTFTVVGAYSLFHRPARSYANNQAVSSQPLRQIMGGGSSPRIIPEATELYIRLTLLGEWYRELFNFRKDSTQQTGVAVSMIPAFDGIWSDFIKVVFVDAASVNDGGYTAGYAEDLINSISKIYTHYKPKYGADVCTKILENFVAEVNMRYGLVLREQIDKYIDARYEGLKDNAYDSEDDNVDYDILDSKHQYGRKTAPSDRFRKETHRSSARKSMRKNKELLQHVRKFRKDVENSLQLSQPMTGARGAGNPYSKAFETLGLQYASVDDLVAQTQKRIGKANSDEKKYSIIQSMVLGVERYSDVDYDAMLMFHETVINPITILFTVYKMLNHWNRFANSMHMDLDAIKRRAPMGGGAARASIVDIFTIVGGNPTAASYIAKIFKTKKYYDVTDSAKTEQFYYRFDLTAQSEYHKYFTATPVGAIADDRAKKLMEDVINHLFYLTCDKNPMVEMHFSGDGKKRYPMLSFKKMEKYVIELMAQVKDSLDKFRKILPHGIIDRYENNMQKEFTIRNSAIRGPNPDNPNVASLFYLKEHLVDRLIKNKYGGGLSDANKALRGMWLVLTNKEQNDGHVYPSFYDVISKFTHWNSAVAVAGGAPADMYRFRARRLQTNGIQRWSHFPINVIGITKQSTLVDQRVPKQVAKAIMSNPPNANDWNAVGNVPTEIWRGQNLAGANRYMRAAFGHNGVYDYDHEYGRKTTKQSNYGGVDGNGIPEGHEGGLGLVFKLNRLLFHYVNMFTDKTSGKIYLPLLEKFANGMNSREVMKGLGIDDITTTNTNAIPGGGSNAAFPRYELNPRSVLFATMARAIRNIVTDKKSGVSSATILTLAEPNLLNVSDYMKDLMCAYLPIFEKQLNIICCKADMLKSLVENTKLSVAGGRGGKAANIPAAPPLAAAIYFDRVESDGVAESLYDRAPAGATEANGKGHLITLMASIIGTARSLQKCVRGVYKELADMPLYFETYQNSIADYKNRNGVLPLTPLSHVSHLLNNHTRLVDGADQLDQLGAHTNPSHLGGKKVGGVRNALRYHVNKGLIPHVVNSVGSDEFKFAYGTRGLLSDNSEPSIDLAPGVMGVLDTYNSKVGGAMSYDKNRMTDIFVNSTHLLRWATDYMYHKTYLGDQDLDKLTYFYVVGARFTRGLRDNTGALLGPQLHMNVLRNLACQTGRHKFNTQSIFTDGLKATSDPFFISTNNVLMLAENDNYKQAVYRMLRCIVDADISEHMHEAERPNLRVYNILDANIVPINFHALQREIPLVNLFNYSYTFDQLVRDHVGVSVVNQDIDDIKIHKGRVDRDKNGLAAGAGAGSTNVDKYNKHHAEDALVRVLIDPKGKVYKSDYEFNIWSLMAGNESLTLNKPKYLSDQLWNKVLLNSLHSDSQNGLAPAGNSRIPDPTTPRGPYEARNKLVGFERAMPLQFSLDDATEHADNLSRGYDRLSYQGARHPAGVGHKHDTNMVVEKTAGNLGIGNVAEYHTIGWERYHTIPVRYIEWFVHTQRIMRLLMRDQLSWVDDPIVHKSNAINKQVTEYESNRKFEISDYE